MKDVAIIIPTLNEERFIASCLDSVISQSFPFDNIDLMVIDGGSSDRTKDIVADYHKKYDNIRLLINPKKIQSVAFNIGVKNSTAPYIIRLDAHALYDKNYVSLCINTLASDSELGNVGGRWNIVPQRKNFIAEANAILNQSKFGIGGAAFRVSMTAGYVDTVPFGAFHRSILEKVGAMREDLARGEDNEFNSRIRKAGYQIYFDPKIVSTYYARDSIVSSAKQMYSNGLSIGKLFYIDKKSVGIRHITPLCFVSAILICLILSLFNFTCTLLLFSLLSLYFMAAIIASFVECRKYGFTYFAILPILFFIIHVSYGLGTIVGILKGK